MKVRWTRRARRNTADIHAYLKQFNPQAAAKVVSILRVQAQGLAIHPHKGRVGLVESTRELVVANLNFIIVYRVTSASVDVLTIRHAAREWPADFTE
ncbi:MAG: type II toxin-antitoxin system RelE/ParE family toxin [Azospirillaceae bacterium]|nr:type II toxin-antitoxin system RelE/ParE family toxin [Azospirillaceae bacterium]